MKNRESLLSWTPTDSARNEKPKRLFEIAVWRAENDKQIRIWSTRWSCIAFPGIFYDGNPYFALLNLTAVPSHRTRKLRMKICSKDWLERVVLEFCWGMSARPTRDLIWMPNEEERLTSPGDIRVLWYNFSYVGFMNKLKLPLCNQLKFHSVCVTQF